MIHRHLNISKKRSFFLFGPRATGKSTLLESIFDSNEAFFVNLLEPRLYEKLQAYPSELEAIIEPAVKDGKIIIIDEIQKVPALLDIVHMFIQKRKTFFGLTGSSARKLKRGAANMLAGRASIYRLFPFLWSELGQSFSLQEALEWGTLPELSSLTNSDDKILFLQSYTDTYIQEEIVAEQIIRKLPPFRRFLQIAAQMNGKIINLSKIAVDISSDPSNVSNYFEVIEDTLLGFKLNAFHTSIRKRQRQSAKFYWFDTGVCRSLQKYLGGEIKKSTSYYGDVFEAFIITQIRAGLEYQVGQYQLSYLLTKDGAEVDLIVERVGQPTLFIEIKSSESVRKEDFTNLVKLSSEIPDTIALCLYNGKDRLSFDKVEVWPWQEGMKKFNLIPNY